MIRIYLDACCVSRLTDDQTQERIRKEANAIETILDRVGVGSLNWVGSVVLELELQRNPDPERRTDAMEMLAFITERIELGKVSRQRGHELNAVGFGVFDALHLACAEQGKVDVFLSTDDRLVRKAKQGTGAIGVRVENPVSWLEEWQQNARIRDE